jgi:hypothetical protein
MDESIDRSVRGEDTEIRRRFVDDGYYIAKNLVMPGLIEGAMRSINVTLGKTGLRPLIYGETPPALRRLPEVWSLVYDSGIANAVRLVLGGPVRWVSDAEVGIRFPEKPFAYAPLYGGDPFWEAEARPHIDGVKDMPKIALAEPRSVLVEAGDVMIAHYLLAHTTNINISSEIRYAVFFRFNGRRRGWLDVPEWNGVGRNVIGFTGMAVVFLGDLPKEMMGELIVWPGSVAALSQFYSGNLDVAKDTFSFPQFIRDPWIEWDGVREVLVSMRPKGEA